MPSVCGSGPSPEPAAPGLGGPRGLAILGRRVPGEQPPPRPASSSSAHGPSLCSSTRSRGPPSLSLPLPLAAQPGTARQPSAVGRAAFPTRLRGPSCCARSARRPSGLGTGEGRPSLPRAQGAVWGAFERPPLHFPSQSRPWALARVQSGGQRTGGKGTPGPPGIPARLLRRHPRGAGLARASPARPGLPRSPGGSRARRRCADLLGKIPGFRPVNRPGVTL